MSRSARNNILGRLRSGLKGEPPAPASACRPVSPMGGPERIDRLKGLMEGVRGEVHVVRTADWLDRLQEVLRKGDVRRLLYGRDTWIGKAIDERFEYSSEDFPERIAFTDAIESIKDAVFASDAGITSTVGAIAETGALVLWPDPGEPRTLSLVPPVHIAVVKADRIFDSFCELMQADNWSAGMPANAVLISGPSKTADIEMTLAFGVHGPKRLVVFILADG
ncbi:MAG: LutC/YkgG family protein [Desulfobacterales bacterium]